MMSLGFVTHVFIFPSELFVLLCQSIDRLLLNKSFEPAYITGYVALTLDQRTQTLRMYSHATALDSRVCLFRHNVPLIDATSSDFVN